MFDLVLNVHLLSFKKEKQVLRGILKITFEIAYHIYVNSKLQLIHSLNTGRNGNTNKTFRRRPERILNVLSAY